LHGPYDTDLMRRGVEARRLICEGEDPHRMLAAVVWPGRDWREEVMYARLTECAWCVGATRCDECGSTGLMVAA
jgi:hypothetical protein